MRFKLIQFIAFIIKIIAPLILGILLLILFLYSGTTFFDFAETKPFSGTNIYNPYESLPGQSYKANFHAHSKAWGGITHGSDADQKVIDAYINKGYDLACLSNYHKISPPAGIKSRKYVGVYEHGFSIKKAHYLAINAKKVSFWDFPLWQTSSHQQTMINKLRENAEMVAIAHPKFGGGRSFQHMKDITGYHHTEVLNHYRNSEEHWDTALSVGKLSWIIANDDIHDLKDPEIFQRWNIIFSESLDDIISNLKDGKNYGVESFTTNTENRFVSCKKTGENTFTYTFEKPADTILFIGQNGVMKQKNMMSDSATYVFTPEDTYIRVVAKNAGQNIYLNPLTRYEGNAIITAADLVAKEKTFLSWLWKLVFVGIMGFVVYLWWKLVTFRVKAIRF
jgi:hypothetical protein